MALAIGAPQLQNGFKVVLPALAVADVITTFFGPLQWGFFQDGVPVLVADNVVSFDYRQDWEVSKFPLEQGAFESYNKVQLPFDVRVRMSVGGTEVNRTNFLSQVSDLANSLELFDAFTPEANYSGLNVIHFDYRREAHRGVGVIVVDIWCQEIRVTATQSFQNTGAPSGADTVDSGIVQPGTPSSTDAALGLGAS